MSGEIEAAGAAATAGLAAAAIEGGRGGSTVHGEGACPNCGSELAGPYCAACGQPAKISRTLGHVIADFAHALFHFDTKAWRTLPLLVGRPGTLTYNYIHGHRARYISPLATFLLCVFLMFFAFSFVGGPNLPAPTTQPAAQDLETLRRERDAAAAERDAARAALAAAEQEAAAIRAKGGPGSSGQATGVLAGPQAEASVAETLYARAEERVQRAETRQQKLAEASTKLGEAESELADSAPRAAKAAGELKERVDQAAAPKEKRTIEMGVSSKDGVVVAGDGDKRWQDELREAVERGDVNVNLGHPGLTARAKENLRNPDLALYKLQETAYKFSFLLVPISLPFIALLFLWKRGVTLFDHVVFSLYSLSFMSLLFIPASLLIRFAGEIGGAIGGMLLFAAPVHLFFHLKGTYALGWFSALWRLAVLGVFTAIAISLFLSAILILGLAA